MIASRPVASTQKSRTQIGLDMSRFVSDEHADLIRQGPFVVLNQRTVAENVSLFATHEEEA